MTSLRIKNNNNKIFMHVGVNMEKVLEGSYQAAIITSGDNSGNQEGKGTKSWGRCCHQVESTPGVK